MATSKCNGLVSRQTKGTGSTDIPTRPLENLAPGKALRVGLILRQNTYNFIYDVANVTGMGKELMNVQIKKLGMLNVT